MTVDDTASLLPGCGAIVENVRDDEALMGVARNPLRDGAPPTGFTFERWLACSMRAIRPEGESTKPSPCFIAHRVSDARPEPRCADCPASPNLFWSANCGRQTSAFVKAMQSILKDDLIDDRGVSPRATFGVVKLSPSSL
jgi:hypothetical protein